VDPCSITFQSVADAMKQVDKVCRLDISNQKLESLPRELAEFKSLQYIDVRNNFLSARDSISLYRLFPNARILFYPQQKIPEPPVNWTFLRRIELDAKGRIDNSSIAYLKTLVTEMQQNRDARLKLVAYYNSQREDKKNASLLLDEFQALLFNRYGFRPFSNRIETEINPVKQADNPARANFIGPPQQKNPADTRYIDIYGLNIGYAAGK
jgi:Leucine-rich repeat (LRR) protein